MNLIISSDILNLFVGCVCVGLGIYIQVLGPLNAGQILKLSLDPKIHLAIVILVIIPCNQCNLACLALFLKILEKG